MENTTPKLGIIESDPWLEPYSAAIEGRHQHALDKELELTGGKGTLSDFATGYLYFGLHRTRRGAAHCCRNETSVQPQQPEQNPLHDRACPGVYDACIEPGR